MKEDASRRANATIKKKNGEVRFIRRVAKKLGGILSPFLLFRALLPFLWKHACR